MIRGGDIDYAEARSAPDRTNPRKGRRLREAARNRFFHVFVLALMLFQVGNASLVPLATGRLGYEHAGGSVLITAGTVLVPQLAAALISTRIAHEADALGRKPLLLAGLGVVAVRAVLFAMASSPLILLPIQLLDGLSAAIIGVMTPLVIADLMRGTGRYNLAQGFAGTATGLGGALSTGMTGYVAGQFGYATAFIGLAFVALIGVAVLYFFLPETKPAPPKP